MNATGRRELRQLRADLVAVVTAVAEAAFYRKAIFDPPARDGWPARFRLRKVKR